MRLLISWSHPCKALVGCRLLVLASLLGLSISTAVAQAADSLHRAQLAAARDLPASLEAIDAENGLGPFKFGMRTTELPEPLTTLRVLKGGDLLFLAPLEVINIGGLLLPGYSLTAHNGQLSRICFGPTNQQNAEVLLQILQQRYGPGKNVGYMRYVWPGQVVTLVFEPRVTAIGHGRYSTTTVQGTAYLESNTLAAEKQAEKLAARHRRKLARQEQGTF